MPRVDAVVPETLPFRDVAAFESWLDANHERRQGVWLKLAKKDSGIPTLTSDEAVDVGLCFGWISGQRKSWDESYYLQKYVPRRPGSLWSQVNVAKVAEMIASGRMRAAGLAEVAAAEADGRWAAAYESQRNASVPEDLARAIARRPRVAELFDALGKTEKYRIVLRIVTARSPSARTSSIAKAVAELEARAR